VTRREHKPEGTTRGSPDANRRESAARSTSSFPSGSPELAKPAFRDEDTGRVTLGLEGPPLTLPGEGGGPEQLLRHSSRPDPTFLDAWSVDRLRRSSLPPSAPLPTFSSAPPANDASEGDETNESDILKLVSQAPRAQSLDLVTEMTERFALGDFSGALRAAELLLGQHPSHAVAQHYANEAAAKLEEMYTSRLQPKSATLQVAMPSSEIAWLGLDPQVGALLPLIDGQSTYETLLSHCGMPRLWVLRALSELLDARVIRLV
jgi:hypothetical protein